MQDALAKVELFQAMTPGDLDRLAAITVARSYPENAVIVNEGDRADTLYLVVSGSVKFFVTGEDGRKVVLGTEGPGGYFGELALDEGVRSASAVTVGPSRMGLLERAAFLRFLADHPESSLALITFLIRRTRSLTERVRDLALLDVYGRLAKLLLSAAHEQDGLLVVDQAMTQKEMGERIGASREMVSRILRDLKIGGYLRSEGRRLVIARKPPRAW